MSDNLRNLVKWLAEPVMVVAMVFCATTAIAQPFYVPSGSMEPTLQIGDVMLGTKFAYGYSRWSVPHGLAPASNTRLFGRMPKRGDVVIFRLPRDPSETLVKRVIGLPGDRVRMVAGRLVINGQPVKLEAAGTGQVDRPPAATTPLAVLPRPCPAACAIPSSRPAGMGCWMIQVNLWCPPGICS
jgi:signal peptidase I